MTGLGEDVYEDRSAALDAPAEESQRLGLYGAAPDVKALEAEGWLIEMAIRAMWAVPGKCQFSYDHARAALESIGIPLSTLAAIRARTWVAVPKACTKSMGTAGFSKMNEVGKREIEQIYSACISAAPKSPEE